MNSETDDIILSPAGESRRDAMLGELIGTMQRVHRRRRTRRAAMAFGFMLALMGGLTSLVLLSQSTPRRAEMIVEAPPPRPSAVLEVVRTDPTIVDRYAIAPSSSIRMLDDEALLTELAAMDRPAGLVRSDGRVWLTTDVVDEREEEPQPAGRGSSSTF
jgi:hypothetical protein